VGRRHNRSRFSVALATLTLVVIATPAAACPASAAARDPQRAPAPDARSERLISPRTALATANRTPEVRAERRNHPDLRPDEVTYLRGSRNWGVSYLADDEKLVQVTVDGRTGEVLEAWRGVQAAQPLARGQQGYFGEKFDSWYVWLPLCLLFVAPFFDPRRPFRMLHVDLLVLLGGFGISHFFFNRAEIGTSIPLLYPVLAYFLVRMLVAAFRPRRTGQPLVPFVPAAVLVAGIVLLGGFRVGLSLTYGKVGDVGYGSAVGAVRLKEHQPLYVDSGDLDQHLDTYGPVNYLAYDPFTRIWPPTKEEIERPKSYEVSAARAAAIAFDGLTILGLFLLGIRLRPGRSGRRLGLALAYGWVSFPYTLFPLMSNTNDTLISALLVAALLGLASAPARGAMIALAGAAKFAPLALAPLFASGRGETRRLRAWTSFGLTATLVALITVVPAIPGDGGVKTFYDQTIGFQLARESPFSVWGQNPGLEPLLMVAKVAVLGLAAAVAFVPRRRDALQVAALGAAVVIATQLITIHWFYPYIVWFAPFLLMALFGEYATSPERARRRLPTTITVPPHPVERAAEPDRVAAR
jgi:Glycosyltransferase family 87